MSPVERVGLLFIALSLGCAHVPPQSWPKGAFLSANGDVIPDAELTARLSRTRFTLVGEAHDNACDHEQERRLIELSAKGTPFAVGLEMLTYEQQATLDSYAAGTQPTETVEELFAWKTVWGFPFEKYAPILEEARKAGAPIIGLNVPKSVVQIVRQHGFQALPQDLHEQVTPSLLPPPAAQEAYLREVMAQHQRPGSEAQMDMERFTRIQSLWDSQMAWRAAKAERELQRRVIIVAGVGHVEHGWGIVSRLASFAPGASTLSILPWRGQAIDASAADLFFFCPEAPTPDSAKVSAWTKPDSTSSPRTP